MKLTLAFAAALAFATPAAADELCTTMGSLARSQAEARDAGVTAACLQSE